uniref:Uncharacterized protein n=1 Tax=Romanomermis culicivorax TaxID=13658 RepID=A0A915IUA4_ROMCU
MLAGEGSSPAPEQPPIVENFIETIVRRNDAAVADHMGIPRLETKREKMEKNGATRVKESSRTFIFVG